MDTWPDSPFWTAPHTTNDDSALALPLIGISCNSVAERRTARNWIANSCGMNVTCFCQKRSWFAREKITFCLHSSYIECTYFIYAIKWVVGVLHHEWSCLAHFLTIYCACAYQIAEKNWSVFHHSNGHTYCGIHIDMCLCVLRRITINLINVAKNTINVYQKLRFARTQLVD